MSISLINNILIKIDLESWLFALKAANFDESSHAFTEIWKIAFRQISCIVNITLKLFF